LKNLSSSDLALLGKWNGADEFCKPSPEDYKFEGFGTF
jgi:hypothetical protein